MEARLACEADLQRERNTTSVSRELIDKFSRRTKEIERLAREKYPVLEAKARGPGVSDYPEQLAQGIANLVEPNGKEITALMYYPPAYGESDEELDTETMAEGV